MPAMIPVMVSESPFPFGRSRTEICEHKGIGHPDSICDGVAEAVSQALSAAYLHAYGSIRHHNVDKALLIGGQSAVRFGGGHIVTPIRLIIAGRADPLPGMTDVDDLVQAAARDYLRARLHCPDGLFDIESAVRSGSPNLRRVVAAGPVNPMANDTSFGTGFAPYSRLESMVLRMAGLLGSASFRREFPMAGDDFKIMGMRIDEQLTITIALAFIAREVESVPHYFSAKAAMMQWLSGQLAGEPVIQLNMLDNPDADDESGIYLTVSGLSGEQGDDGQVGRGNRVNGLITPSRPMSLEAAAGKNPVSHTGKLYNLLASELAAALVNALPGVEEATLKMLSCIGQPINRPALIDIQIVSSNGLDEPAVQQIRTMALDYAEHIGSLTHRLVGGTLRVF